MVIGKMTLDWRSRLSLPLFLTQKNKIWAGAIWTFIAACLYGVINHYPFFKPRLLPMTWVDQVSPFIPQTIFIYLSEYPLFITVYLVAKDLKNLNKYLYSFLMIQVLSCIVFILYPTAYPRENFPLTSDLDPFSFHVFSALRAADTPNSCLPSLHVSSCYLSSFIYLDEQREKFPFFFLWATLVGVSTLTTKQHYIVDVIAGFVLAVFVYWVVHHRVTYKSWKEYFRR